MNVRAVFIDMDGTLLNASNVISNRNMEAIYRLSNQGAKVFLATGRHYEVTAPYHKEIGLQTPLICLNGAAIHDAVTGKILQMRTVQLNEARFHELTADAPCNVLIHTANGLYCKKTNKEIENWTKVGQTPPKYIGDLRHANYKDVLKYTVLTDQSCPDFSTLFNKEADVINWDNGFELVSPQVSKWSAIKKIISELRIRPTEVVAIGYGPNDIEMLRHAGTGVAMGNANHNVHEASDFVTGHHDKDGLAEFIEGYLLKSYESYVM